jgi:hypothetical protein
LLRRHSPWTKIEVLEALFSLNKKKLLRPYSPWTKIEVIEAVFSLDKN